MKITLLTHSKEINKKSNTGRLVLEVLGEAAQQVCWDRMHPPEELLREIAGGGVALVYPGPAGEEPGELGDIEHFILIDGTWHEARHIHQRSPYLHTIRRVALRPVARSRYNLRKNQKEAGLCTAETVVELLRATGYGQQADLLEERFLAYMRPEAAMGRNVCEVCE